MTAAIFGELSNDGSRIMLVVQGNDQELRQVAGRIAAMTPAWKSEGPNCLSLPATWPAVVQLGFSFNGYPGFAWAPQQRLMDWTVEQGVRRLGEVPPLSYDDWPEGKKPRPYQVESAAMISHAGKFLLLDDPGLGKTIITIMGIEDRRRRGINVFPMVIIVPSWEVAAGWAAEIAEWAPAWGTPRMHGGPKRLSHLTPGRRKDYADAVFITTYATARRDAADMKGPLAVLRPEAVVLDEVHWMRNPKAKQTWAAQRITKHASTFVGLSGTFIVSSSGDSYPALAAMDPESFPSGERYEARYLDSVPGDYKTVITGLNPAAEPEFRAMLGGQMHRNAKSDVLAELPPKIYSKREIELPPEWMKAYRAMEDAWLAELPGSEEELEAMDTLTRLQRLSQLASSAADVESYEETDPETGLVTRRQRVTLRAPSWKAEALMTLLAERPDQPTAVFTESRQLAMITGKAYAEPAGLRTGYITGVGDGITNRTRRQDKEDFQAGKLDLIICTVAAGGTGITLTASNCAVMMQRAWALDLSLQPEDRVHRIGSEKWDKVEIIDLVAKGTIDQTRRSVLRDKAGQWGQFVRDPRIVRELLGGKK